MPVVFRGSRQYDAGLSNQRMRQAAVLKNIFTWQLFEAFNLESLLHICYLLDLWKFLRGMGFHTRIS